MESEVRFLRLRGSKVSASVPMGGFVAIRKLDRLGTQNNELTMFPLSCYSSLVPRVNPSLLYAVSSAVLCANFAVELLKPVSGREKLKQGI